MYISWRRLELELHHPFYTARSEQTGRNVKEVLLVHIEHEGRTGWGEVAADRYYGQTLDSAEKALENVAPLLGDDPFALDKILDPLWKICGDQTAAIAAVDQALHDLAGKLAGLPTWKMLGLDPERMPLTSFTIGLDEPDIMARKVREATEFPILKIKVGTDRDEAILEAVRAEAPDKILRVDANCGWSSANVLERCRALARFNLELIEQPVPRGDHDALPLLREEGIAPVMADESCIGPSDVLGCVGIFDGINIKLCKCGGIRRALQMIHTARSAGLKVMLGCMVETSVGIAAAAQLAPLADYIDLDGHLLLAEDPFEGIGGAGGRLTLNNRPGLGIRLK